MNPEPIASNRKRDPPALTCFGEIVVRAKVPAELTVKLAGAETPPPEEPLSTVTDSVPTVAISVVVICALRRDDETNVVARGLPFHWTEDCAVKFAPLTLSV